ncbi:unnamed protein product [Linum trigynum]|uniref:Uncharacterized protein n=1 Tax=Linum trigynum TaxID=586398 RepID=A0AAV2E9Y5_9ROSI
MKLNEHTFWPAHSAANRRLPQNVWVNPNLLGSNSSDHLHLGKLANPKPAAPPLLAVAISNGRSLSQDDNVSFFQPTRSRVSLVELPDDSLQGSVQEKDGSVEAARKVPPFMASSQNLVEQLDVAKITADLYKSLESNSLQIQPPRGPFFLPKNPYPRASPNPLSRLEAQENRKRKGKDPMVYKRQEVKKPFPRINRALFIEEPKDQTSISH